MLRLSMLFSFLLVTTISIGLSGCGSSAKSTPKTSAQTKKTAQKTESKTDYSDQKNGDPAQDNQGKKVSDEIEEALSKLSAEDRALAEKQKICPVSEKLLGEMGAPIKLNVKGQDVFICCKGCKKAVLKNPEKYLAKIKK